MTYIVSVDYPGEYYRGYDCLIEKAARKLRDFSGMGFGSRDLGFYCRTEKSAKNLKERVKKLKLKGVKINIYQEERNPESD